MRHKRRGILTLVIALAVVAMSSCGGDSPKGRNSARVSAVLASNGGGGQFFADASTDAQAAIRHKPSGLECVLPVNGEFSLDVFPPEARNPGMSCSTVSGQVATAYVAVYYGDAVDIDTAFGQALAASAGQASPTPWTGEPSAADKAPADGLPHFRISRFMVNMNGEQRFLRVAMAEARGWFLQQIVTAPVAGAEAAEAAAGADWRRTLHAFAAPPPAS